MPGMLDQAIAESEERARIERISAEKGMLEQQMLEEQAPAIWQQFRAAIKAECSCRPKHLAFAVTPNTEAAVNTLQPGSRRTLLLRFLPRSKAVSFVCGSNAGMYPIRLNALNIAVLCNSDGDEFGSVEEAADVALTLLFQ